MEQVDMFSKFQNDTSKLIDWTAPEDSAANEQPLLSAGLKAKLVAQAGKLNTIRDTAAVDAEEKKTGAAVTSPTGGAGDVKSSINVPSRKTGGFACAADEGFILGDGGAQFFQFNKSDDPATKQSNVATSHSLSFEVAKQQTTRKGKTTTVTQTVTRSIPLWSVTRLSQGKFYSENPLLALHQEVTDFLDFMQPTAEEIFLRRMVEWEVRSIAKEQWPDCEVIVYGSMDTGLLLPLSDIDMSILNVPVSQEEALKHIAGRVSHQGLCTDALPQVILKTKVPLVKYLHKMLQVDVDISINAGDGKVNSEKVKDLLKEYPTARPLILLVKYFLQQRDLDVPFKGGMGSFAITLLVISFLQHHPTSTGEADPALCGVGKLLVDFLYYYGRCFNYQRVGVSLSDGGYCFLKPATGDQQQQQPGPGGARPRAPPAVLVEDPGNASNNATSSLRLIQQILPMFENAWIYLTTPFSPPEDTTGDEAISPASNRVDKRPTYLSRILHSDAELVLRRKDMLAAYNELQSTLAPETIEAIRAYRPMDDKQLLKGDAAFFCSGPNPAPAAATAAAARVKPATVAGGRTQGGDHKRAKRSRSPTTNVLDGGCSDDDEEYSL